MILCIFFPPDSVHIPSGTIRLYVLLTDISTTFRDALTFPSQTNDCFFITVYFWNEVTPLY